MGVLAVGVRSITAIMLIATLLSAMIFAQDWTYRALGFTPASDIWPLLTGLKVIAALGPADSGDCFAWNGERIAP